MPGGQGRRRFSSFGVGCGFAIWGLRSGAHRSAHRKRAHGQRGLRVGANLLGRNLDGNQIAWQHRTCAGHAGLLFRDGGNRPNSRRVGPRPEGGEVNSPDATSCPLVGFAHPTNSRPSILGRCLMVSNVRRGNVTAYVVSIRRGLRLLSEPPANLATTACARTVKKICPAQWNVPENETRRDSGGTVSRRDCFKTLFLVLTCCARNQKQSLTPTQRDTNTTTWVCHLGPLSGARTG